MCPWARPRVKSSAWIVDCVRAGVPVPALNELFPGKLDGLDVELIRALTIYDPVVPAELWSVAGMPWAMASNSWVLAGSRTVSGKPILCNDPHLEINRIPPVWYEVILHWNDTAGAPHYAIGATMPGAPGVVLGRNADVAWGVTYSYMDCVDSWVEDCRDGQYRRGDAWVLFRVREETVDRKGLGSVTFRFHDTADHGTIDGDPAVAGYYLSTRWSCGSGTAAATVGALVGLLDASTAQQARTIASGFSNSAWNIVVADRAGSIGSQMTGKMPLRRQGASGLVPLPGWDPANDWSGFANPVDLPRTLDPPDGLIVAANNDLNDLGVLKPINLAVGPYPARRIRQVLESARGKLDVDDMLRLQLDLKSTQAELFLPYVLPLLEEFHGNPNVEILSRWDCGYAAGSLGATLFERFYRASSTMSSAAAWRNGALVSAKSDDIAGRILLRLRSHPSRSSFTLVRRPDPGRGLPCGAEGRSGRERGASSRIASLIFQPHPPGRPHAAAPGIRSRPDRASRQPRRRSASARWPPSPAARVSAAPRSA